MEGATVTLRWTPPAIGPTPTGYVLEGGLAPGQTAQALVLGPAPVVTFPAPRGAFVVRVRGLNGSDVGAPSNEVPLVVEVPVAPSPPAGVTATVQGSTVSLAWRNTYVGGAPLALRLHVSGSSSGTVPLPLGERATFANVPPGTYEVVVAAENIAGSSGKSNPVAFTVPTACSGAPLPPTNVLVYRVGRRVHVLGDAAATGAAPTHFRLAASGAAAVTLDVATRAFAADAPPGSYGISLAAVNGCGASAFTAPTPVVVP